jgi:choline dehydrogenase-like flavoprotein
MKGSHARLLASPIGKRLAPAAIREIYVGAGKKPWLAHVGNLLRSPIGTAVTGYQVYAAKYRMKPGQPSVFIRNPAGRYSLHYHAEQRPRAENRIRLTEAKDRFGLPQIDVDFAFDRTDAEPIVRAHDLLDRALREAGMGHIAFRDPPEARAQAIVDQSRDGLHQIGATRMAETPGAGVVDRNCQVFGLRNLFVASTAVLPTSGQANPTLVGAALALRLAEHLAGRAAAVPGRQAA